METLQIIIAELSGEAEMPTRTEGYNLKGIVRGRA